MSECSVYGCLCDDVSEVACNCGRRAKACREHAGQATCDACWEKLLNDAFSESCECAGCPLDRVASRRCDDCGKVLNVCSECAEAEAVYCIDCEYPMEDAHGS